MARCKLICMSFDGEYVTENPVFESIEQAWDHSNDLGSKWYFYPFHWVVTESGKTIKDTPDLLKIFKGKRVKTVEMVFKDASGMEEAQRMDPEEFALFVS